MKNIALYEDLILVINPEKGLMKNFSINPELQKKIQSIEFERSVDEAVQSFMYDLDFMLMEEQHLRPRKKHPFVRFQLHMKGLVPVN